MQRLQYAVCLCLFSLSAAAAADEPNWNMHVEMRDGSRVAGTPLFDSVRFETEGAVREISIKSLFWASYNSGKWVARTGRREVTELSGKILDKSLKMKTIFGEIEVPVSHALQFSIHPTLAGVDLPAVGDLVMYHTFDVHGGKKAHNLVSPRHHADVQGAKWTAEGKRGGAYEFDGNTMLSIADHEELRPKTFTLAAWVYATDSDAAYRLLASKTDTGSWYGGYGFCRYPSDSGPLYFYAGNYYSAAAVQKIPQKDWVHIAGTFDGKQVMLYVNGEPSLPVKLAENSVTMEHVDTPFIIGGGGGYNWLGKIDELMLYRRALTPREVEKLVALGQRD